MLRAGGRHGSQRAFGAGPRMNGPIDERARWASPGLLARRLQLHVMRPRDHLVLGVGAFECEVTVGADRIPKLVPVADAAEPRLIVTLPPQHVLEQVFQEKLPTGDPHAGEPEQPTLPAHARFSAPSRLVYVLAADDAVELTEHGILTAMTRLPLAVAPLAEPRLIWYLWEAIASLPVNRRAVRAFGRAGVAAAQTSLDRVRATRTLTAAGLGPDVAALEPV